MSGNKIPGHLLEQLMLAALVRQQHYSMARTWYQDHIKPSFFKNYLLSSAIPGINNRRRQKGRPLVFYPRSSKKAHTHYREYQITGSSSYRQVNYLCRLQLTFVRNADGNHLTAVTPKGLHITGGGFYHELHPGGSRRRSNYLHRYKGRQVQLQQLITRLRYRKRHFTPCCNTGGSIERKIAGIRQRFLSRYAADSIQCQPLADGTRKAALHILISWAKDYRLQPAAEDGTRPLGNTKITAAYFGGTALPYLRRH